MRKSSLVFLFVVLIWNVGFSQITQNKIKIYFGNVLCEKQVELNRQNFLKEGKFVFIANETDTVKTVSFTLQFLKGENLSEKFIAINPILTGRFKNNFVYNKNEPRITKIWVENIKIDYKGEVLIVPSFIIVFKD